MGKVMYSDADGRGPSSLLWNGLPEDIRYDMNRGTFFCDDFLKDPTSDYTITQATAGTFVLDATDTDITGGIALADCNSTTVTQGINIQGAAAFLPTAGTTLVFEARIKAADIATGPEFFLGLSELDTTIIGTSAVSSANYIAWTSVTDDEITLFAGEKAGAMDTNTGHTLVEDTWVKLGFKVTGVTKAEQYINGAKQATTTDLATANIPVVSLAPSLVCQSDGTTDSIVHIDWWQVAQWATPATG
jgi:hypothetical protein